MFDKSLKKKHLIHQISNILPVLPNAHLIIGSKKLITLKKYARNTYL